MGTVKDLSQICRCLGGAIGAIGLHPALLLFEQRYVQVTPAAPLVFDYVFQPGGHQHQRGFPVGERADGAGSAADLPVQPLDGAVRPDPGPMLHGEVGVGERLGAAPRARPRLPRTASSTRAGRPPRTPSPPTPRAIPAHGWP